MVFVGILRGENALRAKKTPHKLPTNFDFDHDDTYEEEHTRNARNDDIMKRITLALTQYSGDGKSSQNWTQDMEEEGDDLIKQLGLMKDTYNTMKKKATADRKKSKLEMQAKHEKKQLKKKVLDPFWPPRNNDDTDPQAPWTMQHRLSFVFNLLDRPSSCKMSGFISLFVICVILASVTGFCVETQLQSTKIPDACAEKIEGGFPVTADDCQPQPKDFFVLLEMICILIFTAEYLPRLLTVHAWVYRPPSAQELAPDDVAPSWYLKDGSALKKTLWYAADGMNIVDLLAILPFYLELAGVPFDGQALRVIRLLRVIRVFKLGKGNSTLAILTVTLKNAWPAISLLLFFNMLLMVLFGALIYICETQEFSVDKHWTNYDCSGFAENATGAVTSPCVLTGTFAPGAFVRPTYDRRVGDSDTEFEQSPFRDIPLSFWWVLTTMTTVGYGDFFPTTLLGRCLGVVVFYAGIIFVCMPISIIGQEFQKAHCEYIEKKSMSNIMSDAMRVLYSDTLSVMSQRSINLLVNKEEEEEAMQDAHADEDEVTNPFLL
jgi:hypothetical protein